MQDFQRIYQKFEKKLDRPLTKEEIDFLRWVYEQHKCELNLTKHPSERIK